MTRPTVEIPFVKMEGCGNDYVYVDLERLPSGVAGRVEAEAGDLARRMSDRHFGIGADGLILIAPSPDADAEMRMYNVDGTRGAMCGNALRCIAKYLGESRFAGRDEIKIDTDSGLRSARLHRAGADVDTVDVDMGEPAFSAEAIPLAPARAPVVAEGGARPWSLEVEVGGEVVEASALSMGNPHLVVLVGEGLADLDLARCGPPLESAPWFPDRANVEFVASVDGRWHQRTWERGSGETLACGSGACAVAVALISRGLAPSGDALPIHLRGGELWMTWAPGRPVTMRGPARRVFDGAWRLG